MQLNFLDIILVVLFFQLLSLVPFLLFQKTGKGISNKLLGIFLLAKALCITNFLSFRLYDFIYSNFPHAFYFGSSFTILWGPALYFYIRSFTDSNFKFRFRDILHALPFLTHFLILTVAYHIYNAETKRNIMSAGGLFDHELWKGYYILLQFYILLYTIAAISCVRQYHKKLRMSFSSIEFISLSWMNFVLIGFLIKWSCDLCYFFAKPESVFSSAVLIASRSTLFLFINIMIFKSLKQPYIFLGKKYYPNERKQSLSEMSKETYLQKLLGFMDREKPYLNPDLTMEQLSKMVSIPPRSLTTVLNECLNQNFYDFINSYRVNDSARILLEQTPRYKTILEVLFEVGFNSKSSFNMAFKKYIGMTPTEYRKIQTSQLH
ncbi:MAG: helix-turn-helix domain-containing protein [Bacteroidales bacterium]|jgi:AraC-like DNA-binding protein